MSHRGRAVLEGDVDAQGLVAQLCVRLGVGRRRRLPRGDVQLQSGVVQSLLLPLSQLYHLSVCSSCDCMYYFLVCFTTGRECACKWWSERQRCPRVPAAGAPLANRLNSSSKHASREPYTAKDQSKYI